MNRMSRLLAIVLFLVGWGSEPFAAEADQYRLECKFYRVMGNYDGDTSLTDPVWSEIGNEEAEADPMKWIRSLSEDEKVSFFNIANLTDLGGTRFIADATGWSWNGAPEPPKSNGYPSVEELVAPKVVNRFGQNFVISINPSDPVEYFERGADGLYRVLKSNVETGVRIGAASVERSLSGRAILHDFEVTVSTVEDREPLEGTTLEVGKPIVQTHTFKETFSIQPGLKYGVGISFENYGTVLVQLELNLS